MSAVILLERERTRCCSGMELCVCVVFSCGTSFAVVYELFIDLCGFVSSSEEIYDLGLDLGHEVHERLKHATSYYA